MKLSGIFWRFSLMYWSLILVAILVTTYFGIDNSGVNVGILIIATALSCTSFVKKNKRYFTNKEKKQVVFGFLFIDIFPQIIFLIFILQVDMSGGTIFALTIVGILHLLVIYLGIFVSKKSLLKQGIISG